MVPKDWSEYYKNTDNQPPKPLLVRALGFVQGKGTAIDIGGGALTDAKHLIDRGFDVTVIDKSPLVEKEAQKISSDKLHIVTTSFEEYSFKKSEYDLALAMFALPFIKPEHFNRVFNNIKGCLKEGGIFCGHFFGKNDEWAIDTNMTFHTKEQVQEFLSDMKVHLLVEKESDGKTASGDPKHWHIFYVIAQK